MELRLKASGGGGVKGRHEVCDVFVRAYYHKRGGRITKGRGTTQSKWVSAYI